MEGSYAAKLGHLAVKGACVAAVLGLLSPLCCCKQDASLVPRPSSLVPLSPLLLRLGVTLQTFFGALSLSLIECLLLISRPQRGFLWGS